VSTKPQEQEPANREDGELIATEIDGSPGSSGGIKESSVAGGAVEEKQWLTILGRASAVAVTEAGY